jgi:hypothetical protein
MFSVSDLSGRSIYQELIPVKQYRNLYQWHEAPLPKGVYLLTIKTERQVLLKKLVVH